MLVSYSRKSARMVSRNCGESACSMRMAMQASMAKSAMELELCFPARRCAKRHFGWRRCRELAFAAFSRGPFGARLGLGRGFYGDALNFETSAEKKRAGTEEGARGKFA